MAYSFAHSLKNRPISDWESLEDHLHKVSELATEFADAFQSAHWGRIVGLWHDLGKYSREFQNYLLAANDLDADVDDGTKKGRVDHSTAGAQYANEIKAGWPLVYCIAGHHAGLADYVELRGDNARLEKSVGEWKSFVPPKLLDIPIARPPEYLLRPSAGRDAALLTFRQAFWSRMLFSALVDADFLATESFMSPEQARHRQHPDFPSMSQLLTVLQSSIQRRVATTQSAPEVARHRAEVLGACLAKAELQPGLFSLSVPTGGGKTLSSLAFALSHAAQHHLRRIIYAIPFTSIIEQNADVFRQSLAPYESAVLEQHSNLEPEQQTRWSQLAGENWDEPLIVTTNVQVFESMYASKTSRCRKLHRLARSVIILDEAQSIPVQLLNPCLAALRELVDCYGCSIVLCTATQPALEFRDDFAIGLKNIREIIEQPEALYMGMKRVRTQYIGQIQDDELVAKLREIPQALCILNTRKHAADIFKQLQDLPHAIHLSALMCANHRSDVISRIRAKLQAGEPCLVVSTQLIEAGVDVDFPVVYRAMAGLDSVAQAAGRCNREGKLDAGAVYLFDPESPPPVGDQRMAADTTKGRILGEFDDLLGLAAIREYFEYHYWKRQNDWDKHEVMKCFAAGKPPIWNFREAAKRFQMIPAGNLKPVIIPWGKMGQDLCRQIMQCDPDQPLPPDIYRRVQRLTVQIREQDWNNLRLSGAVVSYGPGESLPVLMKPEMYDARLGLRLDDVGGISAEWSVF